MGKLLEHAKRELELVGLFDDDSDYDGMIGHAVMKMVEVFSGEGHSGFSAMMTLDVFCRVAKFKTLTPLTNDPDEWMEISDDGELQSTRCSSCFSNDNLQTYYDIDDGGRENPQDFVKKT